MRVLYVTHYGILEPLGQSQILPYLTGLARRGISIDILSFEKQQMTGNRSSLEDQLKQLRSHGIRWFPRPYRRGDSLLNLVKDLVTASIDIRRRCARDRIDLLHCRAHIPALMAWPAAALCRKPFLFDFRGFMAEEYVDAGLWKPGGLRFRTTKVLERILSKRCSALVALTNPARDFLQREYVLDSRKLFVIPCCVDLDLFRPDTPPAGPQRGRPLSVVYAGSTSGRYRMAEMLSFFSVLSDIRPGSHFTILSNGDPGPVLELARGAGLVGGSVTVQSCPPRQVPSWLARQDLGLIFLKGGLALSAASPTKLGEYLACGLAVVAEGCLGDVQKFLVDEGVGWPVDSGKPETWSGVLDRALSLCDEADIREKSRQVAGKYFSLEEGVARYARAYEYAAKAARARDLGVADFIGD